MKDQTNPVEWNPLTQNLSRCGMPQQVGTFNRDDSGAP
jgi:hypothetical protein